VARSGDDGQPRGRGLLTARQQAVAELVAEGLTNAEIAERLQLSRATVKGHITVALRRLGLRDRTQLAIHVHRSTGSGSGRGVPPAGC
jgi:DNA-binding NarL/FixJ family response regulator